MTDKQIIKAAKDFTKGILGKKSTTDQCFVVCNPLCAFLNFAGIKCELTEGDIIYDGNEWHHYWITLADGRIIDPTADQFVSNGVRLKNIWLERQEYYKPYSAADYNRKIEDAMTKFFASHTPPAK